MAARPVKKRSPAAGAAGGPSSGFARGRALGPEGERAALAVLVRRGLKLLAAGVRTPYGEIDLALEDPVSRALVIVEVKARSGHGFGDGAESVTAGKRAKLARAALHFADSRGLGERPMRFDVVSIAVDSRGLGRVDHIVDAFQFDDDDPER